MPNWQASLVAQMVKSLPTMQQTQVRSLHQEDALEKEMATHSSIIAWKSHRQRSPAGYSPWGCKESDMTKRLSTWIRTSKEAFKDPRARTPFPGGILVGSWEFRSQQGMLYLGHTSTTPPMRCSEKWERLFATSFKHRCKRTHTRSPKYIRKYVCLSIQGKAPEVLRSEPSSSHSSLLPLPIHQLRYVS